MSDLIYILIFVLLLIYPLSIIIKTYLQLRTEKNLNKLYPEIGKAMTSETMKDNISLKMDILQMYDAWRHVQVFNTLIAEKTNISEEDYIQLQKISQKITPNTSFEDYQKFKTYVVELKNILDSKDASEEEKEKAKQDLFFQYILKRDEQIQGDEWATKSDIKYNLDSLLEKISATGYESLTEEEKEFLKNKK